MHPKSTPTLLHPGLLLLLGLCLTGCTRDIEVPFFNYMDCRAKMRASYQDQGMNPTAADMASKAYCRERFPR
jgi:hypothetical protein